MFKNGPLQKKSSPITGLNFISLLLTLEGYSVVRPVEAEVG